MLCATLEDTAASSTLKTRSPKRRFPFLATKSTSTNWIPEQAPAPHTGAFL
jgi:hypothetical protein